MIREIVVDSDDDELRWQVLMDRYERYAEQRPILQRRLAEQNRDVFVAPYALAKTHRASPFSYCIWKQGFSALLPETDFVVLCSSPTDDHWTAIVAWDELLRVTSDRCLIQEPDQVPARWRAAAWPDNRIQRALRASAVRLAP